MIIFTVAIWYFGFELLTLKVLKITLHSEVEEYEAAFKQFDVDGGGSLSVAEITPLLNDLGKAPLASRFVKPPRQR